MLNLDFVHFLPEMILFVGSLLLFLGSVFSSKNNNRAFAFFSFFVFSSALFTIFPTLHAHGQVIFSALIIDSFANFFRFIFLLCGLIIVLISIEYPAVSEKYKPEFYAFVMSAVLGMMLMAEAINFIMLYIAIELVSISSYILVGFTKTNPKSNEASLKYLLIGTVASASMLYGFSLFYGFTGTTNLYKIGHLLLTSQNVSSLILPLLLMLIGFGFKIAAVPMHMWCPDVYEGAPTPVTAFLSVGPKAAGFAVLIRVLTMAFNSIKPDWIIILALLSVFTMTLGNLTALAQKNIKRMLAYSSISQAGYILIGLVAVESIKFAVPGILIYLLIYLFMNLGAFICVIIFETQTGSENIDDYAGLSQRAPLLAFCLTIFFLSLVGIPPLGGFIGKLFIFAAAVETGYIWLAVAGVVNTVISIFYYFNVVRLMYVVKSENNVQVISPPYLKLALLVVLFLVIIIGLFPHPFICLADFRIGN